MADKKRRKSESGISRAWKRLKVEGQGLASAMLSGGSYANAKNAEEDVERSKRLKRRMND